MKHIHLIGIGGTGLSAIARVLLEKGYTVSGSDNVASPLFKAITAAGAQTFLGHAEEHIAGADLVVRSSAIPDDNPEVKAAIAGDIPVLKRSDFLKELIGDKDTIAVAGSHGKTTTTGMLIWMLEKCGLDPSFILGSVIQQLGCNSHNGTGRYFVIEADEYDYMFLGLEPEIAVITNVEHDHPDCFPTVEDYRSAFVAFINKVRPDGHCLMCVDHPQTKAMMEELQPTHSNILGYGISSGADYRAVGIRLDSGYPQFNLLFQKSAHEVHNLGEVQLQVPGHHNVLNATAALAVLHQLNLPLQQAIEVLGQFQGTQRRFEMIGCEKGVTIIDDYGHHPTEIGATLEAARSRFPGQQIWAIWQPHTYTRTQALEKEFIQSLNIADRVVILKIYGAREENQEYSAAEIAHQLPKEKATYIADFGTAADYLLSNLKPTDVAIFFSAGDATEVSQSVLHGLKKMD
jgi:UDP-N-acetylmuramate--alanine ligase